MMIYEIYQERRDEIVENSKEKNDFIKVYVYSKGKLIESFENKRQSLGEIIKLKELNYTFEEDFDKDSYDIYIKEYQKEIKNLEDQFKNELFEEYINKDLSEELKEKIMNVVIQLSDTAYNYYVEIENKFQIIAKLFN